MGVRGRVQAGEYSAELTGGCRLDVGSRCTSAPNAPSTRVSAHDAPPHTANALQHVARRSGRAASEHDGTLACISEPFGAAATCTHAALGRARNRAAAVRFEWSFGPNGLRRCAVRRSVPAAGGGDPSAERAAACALPSRGRHAAGARRCAIPSSGCGTRSGRGTQEA
jgi:hypothetical protein